MAQTTLNAGDRVRALLPLDVASGKSFAPGKFVPQTELLKDSLGLLVAAGFVEIVPKGKD